MGGPEHVNNPDAFEHEWNEGLGFKRSLIYGTDHHGTAQPLITSKNGTLLIGIGDNASADAFGGLRVSNPVTLFDSKQIFDNQALFWDDQETSGSGTSSTHSPDTASSTLSVSATTAGTRVRQTFMRFNYQPGKSQLIMMTGALGSGGTGLTQCIGYYDENNGLFFCVDDGNLSVVRRTNVTGTPVDNSVTQANWNLDKLDGTGESEVNIDLTKTQIFFIDFEWLGVGRARMGFVIDGVIIYCHEFNNANNLDEVYMSLPNLPVRYEISNDGTGAAASLKQICSTVISEGGSEDNGVLRYESTEGTDIQANTVGTIYVICGIRLKTTHLAATVKLKNQTIINETSDDYEWIIILNPTVATPVTFSDVANSAVQFAPGNAGNPSTSTVTGGTKLAGGLVKASGSSGSVTIGADNALLLGSAIDGTRDELYLCCRPLQAGADINGGLTWRELT